MKPKLLKDERGQPYLFNFWRNGGVWPSYYDYGFDGVLICSEWRDEDGEQRQYGWKYIGWAECPKCGLIWPNFAEPDGWSETEPRSKRMAADSWWGGVVCLECNLLIVDQPDGTGEVYQL